MEAPLQTFLPPFPVHDVGHVLRVEIRKELLRKGRRGVSEGGDPLEVRLHGAGLDVRGETFHDLAHLGPVVSEAGVVPGERLFELAEPLLLQGMEAPATPLRRGFPLHPGALRTRAARVILPFRL